MKDLTITKAAQALAALGHEARLSVFRLLVRSGHEGLNVGEISAHLDMPASTLAHHLRALVSAGLVVQERHGRITVNRADYNAMDAVLAFLGDECCAGVKPKSNVA
ncbi:MAG: helix-turn-helix transcriptional regulator [Rhizobiaceae bacterium]|nr:helix-turn-helix transcriptional regulator [Rhizobiaceae bacterium]